MIIDPYISIIWIILKLYISNIWFYLHAYIRKLVIFSFSLDNEVSFFHMNGPHG